VNVRWSKWRTVWQGEPVSEIRDVRTAIMVKEALPGWSGVDSRIIDMPGKIDPIPHPYGEDLPCADNKPVEPKKPKPKPLWCSRRVQAVGKDLCAAAVLREGQKRQGALRASRILHHETNPGCARALMQKHGERYIWVNPLSRCRPKRWTASLRCRTSEFRIRRTATAVSRRMR
jgi:hypothetical protein